VSEPTFLVLDEVLHMIDVAEKKLTKTELAVIFRSAAEEHD